MAYQKTNWVNGYTPLNASNMNKIEEGIFNNDTFLSSLDIRVEELEGKIGQGGIGSVVVNGNGNALTNASYNPSTKILNFEKNNTFALDSDSKKSLYHLGAYDTANDNTITRQTGYLKGKDLANMDWFISGSPVGYLFQTTSIAKYANSERLILCNVLTARSVDYLWNHTDEGIGINNNKYINIRVEGISTIEALKQWFTTYNIQIQYKLATSYTEEIIEGQPLTTLDQSGSQWIREEWEKGLNLLTGELKKDQFNHSGFYFECKQTGVYTFSIPIDIAYINCDYSDNSGNVGSAINSSELIVNLTVGKSYIFLLNNGDWDGALDFLNTAMLNEGSHLYPYQQYQGGIVREKQLNDQIVKVKEFRGDTSTFNNFTSWVQSNSERIISIMYYDNASGGHNYYNVIFGSDGSVFKFINSEETLESIRVLASGSEGADILKIYYI